MMTEKIIYEIHNPGGCIPYAFREKILQQLKDGNRISMAVPEWETLNDDDIELEEILMSYTFHTVYIKVTNDDRRIIIKRWS
jgi:hypothetical protein